MHWCPFLWQRSPNGHYVTGDLSLLDWSDRPVLELEMEIEAE